MNAATQGANYIKVICDDKDVFILLIYYLPTNKAYDLLLLFYFNGRY